MMKLANAKWNKITQSYDLIPIDNEISSLIENATTMREMLSMLKNAWLDGKMDDVEGILTGDVLTDLLN